MAREQPLGLCDPEAHVRGRFRSHDPAALELLHQARGERALVLVEEHFCSAALGDRDPQGRDAGDDQRQRGQRRHGAVARDPLLELDQRSGAVGLDDALLEEGAQVARQRAHVRVARGRIARHRVLADRHELGRARPWSTARGARGGPALSTRAGP